MSEWEPDYAAVYANRGRLLAEIRADPEMAANAKSYHSSHPIEFINDWCDTYDPRLAAKGHSAHMPLVMFPKQEELVLFIQEMIASGESGLIEKSRDMGATWVSCAISVWLWLYVDGAAIGWGSRKDIYTENFNMSAEQIMKDETFIDRHNAESGVFCLVPDELDIPF